MKRMFPALFTRFAYLAILLSAPNIITACSSTGFRGAAQNLPAAKPTPMPTPTITPTPAAPVPLSPTAKNVTDEFDLLSSSGQIDMVWAIDNSGSMHEEVAQVRSNFKKFLDSLAGRSDTRVALISDNKGDLGIDLASIATGPNVQQVSQGVGSTNALAMVASSLCQASTTNVSSIDFLNSGSASTICGTTVSSGIDLPLRFNGLENGGAVKAAAGTLASFPRVGAKLVIVVVTDDNASGVDQTNFLNMIKAGLPGSSPTVFAFAGLAASQANCDISNAGDAYKTLASQTTGEVFDICSTDWSPNFTKLSQQVTQLVTTKFKLKTPNAAQILRITVDGVDLPAGSFQFANGEVAILDSSKLATTAKKITINYLAN